MALTLLIPSWATLYQFPTSDDPVTAVSDNATIDAGLAILSALLGAPFVRGDVNPMWPQLQDLDLGGGPLTRPESLVDLAVATEISNDTLIKKDVLQLLIAIGGQIETPGMQTWFKVTDLNALVPLNIPGSTEEQQVYDEELEPIPDEFETVNLTWAEWATLVPPQGPWGGFYYVPSSGHTQESLPVNDVITSGIDFALIREYLNARPVEESI